MRFSYYKDEDGGGGGESSNDGSSPSPSSPSSPSLRRQILDGLDLSIPEGTSCALVGESGSGKSTVLRLLARLYDADSGTVLVGGRDVKSVTLESLRRSVGVVPQDVTLFNDSIAANIAYGRADCGDDDGDDEAEKLFGGEPSSSSSSSSSSPSVAATIPFATQAEIEAAASAAAVHDAIMAMPQGYATVVGERGLKLSGGEKQRVALARAFARAPPLLLLDEPTSALDAASEADVLAALRRLAAGRTAVLVAHRLSTAAACDQVVVLEKGKAVEKGTHEELLELGERTRRFGQSRARPPQGGRFPPPPQYRQPLLSRRRKVFCRWTTTGRGPLPRRGRRGRRGDNVKDKLSCRVFWVAKKKETKRNGKNTFFPLKLALPLLSSRLLSPNQSMKFKCTVGSARPRPPPASAPPNR